MFVCACMCVCVFRCPPVQHRSSCTGISVNMLWWQVASVGHTWLELQMESVKAFPTCSYEWHVHRSLVSEKIPSHLAPSEPSRSDGRRPDGMSIIPWTSGKLLVCDATCWNTYTPSNINNGIAVTGAGAVAEKSAAAQDFQMFTFGLDLYVYSIDSWDF